MNAKFRDIDRVSLKPSAREREPVKLTRKKITYLVGQTITILMLRRNMKEKPAPPHGDQKVANQTTRIGNQPGCFPKLAHGLQGLN